MSLHTGKGQSVGTAISDILDYVENPEKTDGGRLITSYQCDSRIADAEFLFSKRLYVAKTGRKRGADDVLFYQIRPSFVPGEITGQPPSHRDRLRMAIDPALEQKPADLDALLDLLREAGIDVSPTENPSG